jgi:hypothetical protein
LPSLLPIFPNFTNLPAERASRLRTCRRLLPAPAKAFFPPTRRGSSHDGDPPLLYVNLSCVLPADTINEGDC